MYASAALQPIIDFWIRKKLAGLDYKTVKPVQTDSMDRQSPVERATRFLTWTVERSEPQTVHWHSFVQRVTR